MYDAARVRQLLHQRAGASGVIEVNVGQEDVVDVLGLEVVLVECVEQQRHAEVGAGIDERGAALRDHQVTGIR